MSEYTQQENPGGKFYRVKAAQLNQIQTQLKQVYEALMVVDMTDLAGVLTVVNNIVVQINNLDVDIEAVEEKLDLVVFQAAFKYTVAGGEQTIFTLNVARPTKLNSFFLDLTELTQNSDIRVKIDGVTAETYNWTTGKDKGLYFREITVPANVPVVVTMQETAAEGVERNIPCYYTYERR